MEVRNCKQCGKLYNYIGGTYRNLCPACVDKVEQKFRDVKKYIEDNPNSDIRMVAEEMDVPVKQIEIWVREERLSFTDDSAMGIPCERCGAIIKSGRFCKECTDKLGQTLNSLYKVEDNQARKKGSSQSKMRFIDK